MEWWGKRCLANIPSGTVAGLIGLRELVLKTLLSQSTREKRPAGRCVMVSTDSGISYHLKPD